MKKRTDVRFYFFRWSPYSPKGYSDFQLCFRTRVSGWPDTVKSLGRVRESSNFRGGVLRHPPMWSLVIGQVARFSIPFLGIFFREKSAHFFELRSKNAVGENRRRLSADFLPSRFCKNRD